RDLRRPQPALPHLTELGQEQLPGEAIGFDPGQRRTGFDQRWQGHTPTLTVSAREGLGGRGDALPWQTGRRGRGWFCGRAVPTAWRPRRLERYRPARRRR